MPQDGIYRRSFLLSGLVAAGGSLLAGCGETEDKTPPKPEDDPGTKAKDSMDFYKNNMNKKGGR